MEDAVLSAGKPMHSCISPPQIGKSMVWAGGGVLQENLELSEESALRSPETLQWGRG